MDMAVATHVEAISSHNSHKKSCIPTLIKHRTWQQHSLLSPDGVRGVGPALIHTHAGHPHGIRHARNKWCINHRHWLHQWCSTLQPHSKWGPTTSTNNDSHCHSVPGAFTTTTRDGTVSTCAIRYGTVSTCAIRSRPAKVQAECFSGGVNPDQPNEGSQRPTVNDLDYQYNISIATNQFSVLSVYDVCDVENSKDSAIQAPHHDLPTRTFTNFHLECDIKTDYDNQLINQPEQCQLDTPVILSSSTDDENVQTCYSVKCVNTVDTPWCTLVPRSV